jgi:hypothetical protein
MMMVMLLLLLSSSSEFLSIVVQLLGVFNNISSLHGLISRMGFAIVEHHCMEVSTPASKSP